MSYIKNEKTYAYADGDGGLILLMDNVVDRGAHYGGKRYCALLNEKEFRELVREIITRTSPSWVKPKMVNESVDKFFEREKRWQ